MKIGLLDLAMGGWAAGATYTRMLAQSLAGAGVEPVIFGEAGAEAAGDQKRIAVPASRAFPGEATLRQKLGWPPRSAVSRAARAHGIDVLLPVTAPLSGGKGPAKIGWIPDFQHRHLPQFYSEAQRRELDARFAELARSCDLMLLSSESARDDFLTAMPDLTAKARVAPFPSLFAFDPLPSKLPDIRSRYGLPERFAVVINQMWQHKNHIVVPRALRLLAERGQEVFTVMAGLPADHRDRQNRSLSALLQECAAPGVWPQVRLLGQVSREELVALLRSATVLIQPSLFEGWNTSVQDAVALGCPVVASDLPVHREQLGEAGHYFPPTNPEALAAVLAEIWPRLPARPEETAEQAALQRERVFAASHGRKLVEICQELAG